jgi:drug/metabolite transporter (DMT)-like permease
MIPVLYIFAALVLYTTAILLGTYATRHAGPAVVSLVTNIVAVVAGLAFVMAEMSHTSVVNQRNGLIAAGLGGIAIGAFTVFLNKSFATSNVAIVSPVVFGGAIVLSAILGTIIFKERITQYQAVGLVLVTAGLVAILYAKATGK